jgi:hypothetical protein
VLLSCIIGDDWREHDEAADYEIVQARALLFELVGGEPGEKLRNQLPPEQSLSRGASCSCGRGNHSRTRSGTRSQRREAPITKLREV